MPINVMLWANSFDPRIAIAKKGAAVPAEDKNANSPKNEPAFLLPYEALSLCQLVQTAPDKTAQVVNNISLITLTFDLKQEIERHGYPDSTVQAFMKEVLGWKKFPAMPMAENWEETLTKAREEHRAGRLSLSDLADIETRVIAEMGRKIQAEFRNNPRIFDLQKALNHRQGQCLSFTEMVFALAAGLEFPVQGASVSKMSIAFTSNMEHVIGLVGISDDRKVLVDLVGYPIKNTTPPFSLEARFEKDGNYLELKPGAGPKDDISYYTRIKLLDLNDLIAFRYSSYGKDYEDSGDFQQAIAYFDTAISISPTLADTYCKLGVAYFKLHQYSEAVNYFNIALGLDPKDAIALNNRGRILLNIGQIKKGIEDLRRSEKIDTTLVTKDEEIINGH